MPKLAFCLVAVALFANPALAQSDEVGGEISGYGGVFGGGHGFVGASSGVAFSKYALGLLDVSYARLGTETMRAYTPEQRVEGSNFYDINACAHIRFPINRKLAPYAIIGPSVVWNGYHYGALGPNGARVVISKDDVNFGFHTGGGVRYHVNQNWGVRPEVRVVITNQTFVTFSIGVFFNVDSPL